LRNEQLLRELERANSEHAAAVAAMEQVWNRRACWMRMRMRAYIAATSGMRTLVG
jgi:hypothetical protein